MGCPATHWRSRRAEALMTSDKPPGKDSGPNTPLSPAGFGVGSSTRPLGGFGLGLPPGLGPPSGDRSGLPPILNQATETPQQAEAPHAVGPRKQGRGRPRGL